MEVCPAFVDETGVLTASVREQPVYGIGLLVLPDPQPVTDSFYKVHFNFAADRMQKRNDIRRAILAGDRDPTVAELNQLMWATRHHEYKFSEVTSHNLQQYVDLLNVYFSFPDLEFHALLIDRRDPQFSLERWGNDAWKAYLWLARELLKRRLKRKVFAIIDLQGMPKDADDYVENTVCSVPNVSGCLRAASEMSVFLQVVDVLLGCVQFDWKDQHGYYGATSKRAEAKRELAAFVKARLRLGRSDSILTNETNFRRRMHPSTFTAWKWQPKG